MNKVPPNYTRTLSVGILILQIFFSFTVVNAADLQLADHQHIDPKGFFQIVPPNGWEIKEYPQDPRGKGAFLTDKNRVDFRILINAVNFSTFEDLVASCEKIGKRLGLNTNIKRIELNGRPAGQQSFVWKGLKFLYYDFLIDSPG